MDAEYGVDPALDRMPATDAVPMMLPPGVGLSADVLPMAGAAYLAARKTLEETRSVSRGNAVTMLCLCVRVRGLSRALPERVGLEHRHEVVGADIGEDDVGPRDARVGEEDIEAAIAAHGVVNDGLDRGLVSGIEAARMDLDARKGGRDVARVRLEVRAVVVTQVQRPGAALSELVGRGAPDAQGRVGAFSWVRSVSISWRRRVAKKTRVAHGM